MASRKVETLTKLAKLLLKIKLLIHNLCEVNSITHTHFDPAQRDDTLCQIDWQTDKQSQRIIFLIIAIYTSKSIINAIFFTSNKKSP
jgi:hypothetical protein